MEHGRRKSFGGATPAIEPGGVPDSGLPQDYRRILDLLVSPLAESGVIQGLQDLDAKEIRRWMDELETRRPTTI
jgi:hypothetical protein